MHGLVVSESRIGSEEERQGVEGREVGKSQKQNGQERTGKKSRKRRLNG